MIASNLTNLSFEKNPPKSHHFQNNSAETSQNCQVAFSSFSFVNQRKLKKGTKMSENNTLFKNKNKLLQDPHYIK